jgi:hypothetical protein
MKQLLHYFLFFVTAGILFTSCQKELSGETNTAIGTLTEDVNGNCAAITTNGSYVKDVTLDASNYLDVQVNIIQPGNYVIKTNTVNGYYFYDSSTIVNTGLNTIRLKGFGKPIAVNNDALVVKFGTSECEISIIVTAGLGTGIAKFTLVGSPTSCTGAAQTNNYFVDLPTSALTHKDTIYVDVTEIGTYTINATTTPSNGLTFSKSGSFTNIGPGQKVILEATGTPSTAGSIPYTITTTNPSSNCGFNVTVLGPAAFTMNCAGVTLGGVYQQGNPIGLNTNTITIPVTVTTSGFYNITTTTIPAANNNGITFVGVGPLTPTTTSIVLYALPATPAVNGNFIYNVAAGGTTCGVTVNYLLPPPPAAFTINCASIVSAGNYRATVPLNTSNTVTLTANATTAGLYNITTNVVNGVQFVASGSMTLGANTIVLRAAATNNIPTAAATSVYSIAGSTCTFPIVYSAAPTGVFQCKIDGTLIDFNLNDNARGSYLNLPGVLINSNLQISGNGLTPTSFSVSINKSNSITPSIVTTGTFLNTLAASLAGNYFLGATYRDDLSAAWSPKGVITGTPDGFTIVISSLTATRVIGTFSGTIRNSFGAGTSTKVVTEGVFNLPIQ